ncbi:MAG: hypothetical protein IJA65_03320, partial [Acholeplasmatales bacterium]|nr:hypothetical protein [Acholeplasmatales bacterium]
IGKYPIGILYFDVDPLLVDVNVHPTKTEIKIANEELICEFLIKEVKNMLSSSTHIPTREIPVSKPTAYTKQVLFDEKPEFIFNESINDVYISSLVEDKNDSKPTMEIIKEATKVEIKESKEKLPYMEYVGSVFGTYLIFQNNEGMYMLDQHAAAERINYEKYYEILGDPNQPTTELLLPIILRFTKQDALYIEDNLESFAKIGFILESLGETDYVVRVVPLWAKLDNIEDIIYEILSNMISNNKVDVIHFRDSIAKQISCKSSIKANHALSKDEIDYLVCELRKCKNPYTCPHGRPSLIKITVSEIEKMFERIQK